MSTLNFKNALILLFALATFNLYAQKKDNTIQDFKSPFKSKSENKKENIISRKPANESQLRFETNKGSFGISLEKYNLTQQQLESNLNGYLGLNERNTFKKIKKSSDELGYSHLYYQQLYNNFPVEGSVVMLHLIKGKPNSINGHIALIENLVTTVSIDSNKALLISKDYTKVSTLIQSYPIELLIAQIPKENGFQQRLAFKVRIDANKPFTMCNVYVDAVTGKVINKISLITDADVTANANTLYSGTQKITTDSYTGGYRLRDNARKIETYDATNATFSNVTGFTGYSDISNSTTTWSGVPRLKSFTIDAVSQNWWYTPLVDIMPDLYIVIRDASNQIVYKSAYYDNTFPTVTFNNLDIVLSNPPYAVEIWDYDAAGADDFGGSYTISSTVGTQTWSGSGNSGSYINDASNNPALDVHWGMEKTYDFYKNVFGRNSFDGNGSKIKNFLNPSFLQTSQGNSPNNAFALPSPLNVMCYGLGDGVSFRPEVCLDIVGHEFTHMVIANNGLGGLTYQSESGALNESFADIFGTCIEFYSSKSPNWTHGENNTLISPYYTRSLSNPNSGIPSLGWQQPDTYLGTYWKDVTNLTNDNGGVHFNSGVQNYWFYLLSQGGNGTNDLGNVFSVTGIGINQARQIAYKNLTTYLGGANATYQDAYNGSLLAAEALYGNPSTQYSAVRAAWYAVGIGSDPNSYCSGITLLTSTTGAITDGSGNANYGNNSNCKWKIVPPGADSIKITFTSFNTEANYDSVIIYNGPDSTYPKLMSRSGNTIPPTITTTVGAAFIQFVSDNTTTSLGWSINYITYGVTTSCNGGNVLTTPTGTFSDGSGTANYGNNQFCNWLIAPPCATSVTLSLTQLNTEANHDGVIVYNGNNTKSPIIGVYTGTILPSSVTSSGGEMLVVFISDYSTTGQGFTANYTSTGSSYCSGTTTLNTSDNGTITDGSSSSNYCNNQNCSWLIQPPQATSVSLRFTKFNVEAASTDGQSIYDAVEVYDGTSTTGNLLGRFTGNKIPPLLTANSGSMFVKFYSDLSVNDSGWSAIYTSTSPSYCNSNSVLTSQKGIITDGSGINNYANNSNCSWLINPTNLANVSILFDSLDTELNNDGILIYDGDTETQPLLKKVTGNSIPNIIKSTSNKVLIKFLTDESNRKKGWGLNYFSSKYDTLKLSSCIKVVYNNKTFTNTVNFVDTMRTSKNQDSVLRFVDIKITPITPNTINKNLTSCNSIVYNGKTYTSSTVVRDTIKSIQGCDSIYNVATIKVTPIIAVTKSNTLTGCNSVVYNSKTYTYSAVVRDTVKSYQGCDSLYNVATITIRPNFAGYVKHPISGSIANVTATLTNGTTTSSTRSATNGNYKFSCLSPDSIYTIRPSKNNDSIKNNGVSVIDAILVQSHVLNKSILNSPYKIIAADVNNSGDVSAIDILFIKRLALGIDTTFKGNRLWAFVDSAYQFPDPTNPFPYKDSIGINNLTTSLANQSFIGIKLGDVNYDWNPSIMGANAKVNKPIELYYNNINVSNEQEIRVPIKVKSFKNILGMQYTLNFNSKALELKGFEQNKLNVEYGINKAKEGKISFLWNDAKGIAKTLDDGSVLMELVFTKKASFTQEDLTLSNDIATIEAWDGNLQKHNIVKTSGSILQKQEAVIAKESWEVVPNPTTDGKVKVSINLQSAKELELKLTSLDGKLLMQQKLSGKKGLNTYSINLQSQMKLAKGVYYLQANGLEGDKVKVIMIE